MAGFQRRGKEKLYLSFFLANFFGTALSSQHKLLEVFEKLLNLCYRKVWLNMFIVLCTLVWWYLVITTHSNSEARHPKPTAQCDVWQNSVPFWPTPLAGTLDMTDLMCRGGPLPDYWGSSHLWWTRFGRDSREQGWILCWQTPAIPTVRIGSPWWRRKFPQGVEYVCSTHFLNRAVSLSSTPDQNKSLLNILVVIPDICNQSTLICEIWFNFQHRNKEVEEKNGQLFWTTCIIFLMHAQFLDSNYKFKFFTCDQNKESVCQVTQKAALSV